MGTCYYRIETEEEILRRKKILIDEINGMGLTPNDVNNRFGIYDENSWQFNTPWDNFTNNIRIHLGKRSHGWKFTWNFHENKYYTNKEELLAFIRRGRVVDEYGDLMDNEEFIKMALEWGQPDGLTIDENYAKKYPSAYLTPSHYDREVDGLRVCSSTEFS